MKTFLFIKLIFLSLLIGCNNKEEIENIDLRKNILEEYGVNYFDTYDDRLDSTFNFTLHFQNEFISRELGFNFWNVDFHRVGETIYFSSSKYAFGFELFFEIKMNQETINQYKGIINNSESDIATLDSILFVMKIDEVSKIKFQFYADSYYDDNYADVFIENWDKVILIRGSMINIFATRFDL